MYLLQYPFLTLLARRTLINLSPSGFRELIYIYILSYVASIYSFVSVLTYLLVAQSEINNFLDSLHTINLKIDQYEGGYKSPRDSQTESNFEKLNYPYSIDINSFKA